MPLFHNLETFDRTVVTQILIFLVDVHNVCLVPSDNPLTISECNDIEVQCKVNSNAFPAPVITWYLGSTVITIIEGSHETSITLVGNRTDNKKPLQCKASSIYKEPMETNTTLNVECKFNILLCFFLY